MSKGGKILIIEDESDVSTYLQTILTANGYETAVCETARHGMDMVRQFQPDLISLDIMMPQETGISFFVKLRQAKDIAFIPVVIISGAVQEKEFNLHSYVDDESIPRPFNKISVQRIVAQRPVVRARGQLIAVEHRLQIFVH